MKTQILKRFLLGALIFGLTSCVYVDNTPGPPGRPGEAWFGVDYDTHPLYSYWDNNSSIPYNPYVGTYYFTYPGIYDFEYFFNRYEYWYGTYEIWVNLGEPGGPHGEHGCDGLDTYLMLICDPYGPHEHRDNYKSTMDADEQMVIERDEGKYHYRIVMSKANVNERPANEPKFKSE